LNKEIILIDEVIYCAIDESNYTGSWNLALRFHQ